MHAHFAFGEALTKTNNKPISCLSATPFLFLVAKTELWRLWISMFQRTFWWFFFFGQTNVLKPMIYDSMWRTVHSKYHNVVFFVKTQGLIFCHLNSFRCHGLFFTLFFFPTVVHILTEISICAGVELSIHSRLLLNC